MKKLTRCLHIVTAICCALAALYTAPVSSAKDVTLDCTYVPIVGNGFVADTFNGVPALYNQIGETLYCDGVIIRYYRTLFGLEVQTGGGTPVVTNSSDLYFAKTTSPKPGDVLYADAAARGKGHGHWAMVKSNNGGTLTLFEQNWVWNGKAGVDRVIPNPSCYTAYTLCSRSGAAVPTVGVEPEPSPEAETPEPELSFGTETPKPEADPALPAADLPVERPAPVTVSFAGADNWMVPYLQEAAAKGVFLLDHDYNGPVTRDDFCQMALNILRNNGVKTEEQGAAGAVSIGLVSDGDGTKNIDREEAACIASRLLVWTGTNPDSARTEGALNVYHDAAEISDWARDAAARMTACGLMNGSNDRFNPKARMTNAQAVTLMVRVNELTVTTGQMLNHD